MTAPEPPSSESGSPRPEPGDGGHGDGLTPESGGFHTWTEDVLAGPPPPPVDTGGRTRFTRRRDVVVAIGLVVAVAAGWVLLWQASDLKATATAPRSAAPSPAPPELFPPSLGEAWRAESPATPEPVAAGPVVVTAQDGEVIGRDPLTGEPVWSYRRDLPLCTVTAAWQNAVAVYRSDGGFLPDDAPRGDGGCSEVTSLNGEDGSRAAQRNWDAELDAELVGDGTYLTASGQRLITTLRSDLVETMEYGQVPAQVVPDRQPRTGCAYDSVFMNAGRIAVIERCPDDLADRLTVYKATAKDADRPEVVFSEVLDSESAQVVAMTDRLTAVALPDPARLLVFGDDGARTANVPLQVGALRQDGPVAETVAGSGAYHWHTGSATVALSMEDLKPLWTVPDTLGPGTLFAGRMLVPVADGLAVIDQTDGSRVGTFPVDRGGYTGPVAMSTIGPIVLEQRGPLLVALR
ncbi:hypothetical protein [Actinokineospora sp. UTMC 2448]|uniref:Rv3212 family protein n=1 Tax=Actinokineospora sp. UTMC 2448 TaxID=2268449 RepID=UPI0021646083|nr:hypothetical protein [Actinokineospora sp. UTMC 2448]UVS77177.1 hypothetical protein Actkin_00879 [Actinokineospora sp. UTMC 2448]